MATTKAATKKAESAAAELEKLQSKYNKAVQEGTEQEEIIVMLQQQIQKGEKRYNLSVDLGCVSAE
jgi:hypothetical protein